MSNIKKIPSHEKKIPNRYIDGMTVKNRNKIPNIDDWVNKQRSKLRYDYQAIFDIESDPKLYELPLETKVDLANELLEETITKENEKHPERNLSIGDSDIPQFSMKRKTEYTVYPKVKIPTYNRFINEKRYRFALRGALNSHALMKMLDEDFIPGLKKAIDKSLELLERDQIDVNALNRCGATLMKCIEFMRETYVKTPSQELIDENRKLKKMMAGMASGQAKRAKFEEQTTKRTLIIEDGQEDERVLEAIVEIEELTSE